jgi:pimeloyl-ACP methyl ester carboxylesterase
MATVRANGVDFRVNRYRVGDGAGHGIDGQNTDDRPVLVFIHGLGIVDHSGLSFTLGMPLASDADAILYALRGHGQSEIVPSGYKVSDHVADLVALIDALGVDRPVHLVGCSFGAVVATATALAPEHRDRVASIVFVDPLLPLDGWAARILPTLEVAAEALSKDFTVEDIMVGLGLPSRRKAQAVAARGSALLLGTTLLDDLRDEPSLPPEDFARIDCPVTAVFGTASEMYATAGPLQQMVPQTDLHTIADADHLQVFGHAPEIERLIREHLGLPLPDRVTEWVAQEQPDAPAASFRFEA